MTRKDRELFYFLHAVKVATFDQVNKNVYQLKAPHVLYKRIRRFRKLGFIRSMAHPEIYPTKVFSLTRNGFKTFVADGSEQRVEIGSSSIVHDLRLVDIRHRLLNDQIATDYITENSLKSWESLSTRPDLFPYVQAGCDAVAEIPVGRGCVRFAIEYEAQRKHWDRYNDILSRYYNNEGIPGVIYVCRSTDILETIRSRDRSLFADRKPKVLYVELNQIVKGDSIVLVNREGMNLLIYPRFDGGQQKVNSGSILTSY